MSDYKKIGSSVARKVLRSLGDDAVERDIELASYVRRWVMTEGADEAPEDRYFSDTNLGHEGISLDREEHVALLDRWSQDHAALWKTLREDRRINTEGNPEGPMLNPFFHTPDAEIYAAMIADHKPDRVVEVGSGFSTRVARRTIESEKLATTLHIFDPEPRTEVRDIVDQAVLKPVEQTKVADLGLTERSLLFIDSSHITRGQGDVTHLFLQVLPALPRGVLVHVHDIFIPFEYPLAYLRRIYTEQYLLQMLLTHSSRYKVLFATHWMSRIHPADMKKAFGVQMRADGGFSGASFWFRA